jgi:hypothetical protein
MPSTPTTKYGFITEADADALVGAPGRLRTLVSAMDAAMAGYAQGTLASLPGAAVAGKLYRTTDTGQVFIDTGSAWIELVVDPGLAVWRRYFTAGPTRMSGGLTSQIYAVYPYFGAPQSSAQNPPTITAGNLFFLPRFHIVPADVAVANRTTKLRLVTEITVNGTAPSVNFTFDLVPITAVAGLTTQMQHTVGASVASVTVNTPAASVATRGEGTAVTLPAAGVYCVTVTPSGTLGANSEVVASAGVEMRHI